MDRKEHVNTEILGRKDQEIVLKYLHLLLNVFVFLAASSPVTSFFLLDAAVDFGSVGGIFVDIK